MRRASAPFSLSGRSAWARGRKCDKRNGLIDRPAFSSPLWLEIKEISRVNKAWDSNEDALLVRPPLIGFDPHGNQIGKRDFPSPTELTFSLRSVAAKEVRFGGPIKLRVHFDDHNIPAPAIDAALCSLEAMPFDLEARLFYSEDPHRLRLTACQLSGHGVGSTTYSMPF